MRFSILAAITASLGFVAANESKLCTQLTGAIQEVTTLSAQAKVVISPLTDVTVITHIPTITAQFQAIIQAVTKDITMMSAPFSADMCTVPASSKREIAPQELSKRTGCKLNADESAMVLDVLVEFVRVHQDLLAVVISKGGLLPKIPIFGAPVAAVLRSLESVVDSIAFLIIDVLAEASGAKAEVQFKSLDVSVGKAINAYTLVTVSTNPLGVGINL